MKTRERVCKNRAYHYNFPGFPGTGIERVFLGEEASLKLGKEKVVKRALPFVVVSLAVVLLTAFSAVAQEDGKASFDDLTRKLSDKEQELRIITHELSRIRKELEEIAGSFEGAAAVARERKSSEGGTDQEDFKRVQRALKLLGYYDGEIDGIFGPQTNGALKSFRDKERLDVSWRLNSAMCLRLTDRLNSEKIQGLSDEDRNDMVLGLMDLCRRLIR